MIWLIIVMRAIFSADGVAVRYPCDEGRPEQGQNELGLFVDTKWSPDNYPESHRKNTDRML